MTGVIVMDHEYPEDETDLTSEQFDALAAGGESVELIEVHSAPQGVTVVVATGNFGAGTSQVPVTISGSFMTFAASEREAVPAG